MIFTTQCPSCEATFPIDSAKVPDGGVYARCSQCEGVFLVEVPVSEAAPAMSAIEASPVAVPVAAPSVPEVVQPPIPEAPAPIAVEPTPAPIAVEATPTPPAAADQPPVSDPFAAAPLSEPAPAPVAPPAPAAPASPPTFGKRDPNERAQRLARVLVSDMIAYHPDRHRTSLEAGSLKADFEEEIDKSWSEYVEQVGKDLAESTTYFTEALNEILAKGASVF